MCVYQTALDALAMDYNTVVGRMVFVAVRAKTVSSPFSRCGRPGP